MESLNTMELLAEQQVVVGNSFTVWVLAYSSALYIHVLCNNIIPPLLTPHLAHRFPIHYLGNVVTKQFPKYRS
jgi:hypothetical protein